MRNDRGSMITELELQKAHENAVNHKCPGGYFCTVATTCYEPEERIRTCEACWIKAYIEMKAMRVK